MDRSSRLKEIFFNNLLLLGFDKISIEKEYRVACDKNMFCVPNQKMFEAVTHFLFSKLKGKYVLPWPLLDKDQHRQFQKLTYDYLSTISQKSQVKFPRITPSLLSTLSGERFYELYVAFSSHVVEQEIKAIGNVEYLLCPKVSASNCKNSAEILKIETVLSTEKSQYIQKLSREHFEELLMFSNDFSLLFKRLKSTLMANHTKCKEQLLHLSCLYSKNSTSEETSTLKEKVADYQTKVQTQWALLEKFLLKENELWKYLSSEVEEKSEKYVLDSTLVNVTVPDIITKEHSEELKAMGESSGVSEENRKPNLLRHIQLFRIVLESYLKSYQTGNVSNMHSHCKVENTQNLDESLNKMNLLCEEIVKNLLSNVKESTENLHQNLLVQEFSEDLEHLIKECPSWDFCSNSFHERIKFSRSNAFLPFSNEDENSKLSLFSSTKAECNSDESSCSEETFGAGCNSCYLPSKQNSPARITLESITLSKDITIAPGSLYDLKDLVLKEPLKICNKNVETMNKYHPKNMLPDAIQNNHLQETIVGTIPQLPDPLIDFDFDYSKPFKMRESWQLEDSLQAITIPDDNLSD